MGQHPPLPMVALHPDALKNLAEFWASLGNTMRASLTITVTISVPVFDDVHRLSGYHGTPPVTPPEPAFRPRQCCMFGGRVLDRTCYAVSGRAGGSAGSGLARARIMTADSIFSGRCRPTRIRCGATDSSP